MTSRPNLNNYHRGVYDGLKIAAAAYCGGCASGEELILDEDDGAWCHPDFDELSECDASHLHDLARKVGKPGDEWQKEKPSWYEKDGALGLVLLDWEDGKGWDRRVMMVQEIANGYMRVIGSHFAHDFPNPSWYAREEIVVPPLPEFRNETDN